ncbi:hypothetical protein OUZ56_003115 [Daphnia magna]|uniref:Uncharacterized protein n=1 Tax=Daphnia magna TaxID=35525 RepID=A0ABR0A7U6_9CRUS|nr:hypothetical protein OUZ56_003115 [Daphnia magna]
MDENYGSRLALVERTALDIRLKGPNRGDRKRKKLFASHRMQKELKSAAVKDRELERERGPKRGAQWASVSLDC